jgi:hypothetical protein
MVFGLARAVLALFVAVGGALSAGCATQTTAPTSDSRAKAPATASSRYNLAGYSSGFKAGYGDACGSPRRRSEERYKSDTDYRMGWDDGQSLCKK